MEYNGIQFLIPLSRGGRGQTLNLALTCKIARNDPDGRPYYIPLQTRLTQRHSGLTPSEGNDARTRADIPERLSACGHAQAGSRRLGAVAFAR